MIEVKATGHLGFVCALVCKWWSCFPCVCLFLCCFWYFFFCALGFFFLKCIFCFFFCVRIRTCVCELLQHDLRDTHFGAQRVHQGTTTQTVDISVTNMGDHSTIRQLVTHPTPPPPSHFPKSSAAQLRRRTAKRRSTLNVGGLRFKALRFLVQCWDWRCGLPWVLGVLVLGCNFRFWEAELGEKRWREIFRIVLTPGKPYNVTCSNWSGFGCWDLSLWVATPLARQSTRPSYNPRNGQVGWLLNRRRQWCITTKRLTC